MSSEIKARLEKLRDHKECANDVKRLCEKALAFMANGRSADELEVYADDNTSAEVALVADTDTWLKESGFVTDADDPQYEEDEDTGNDNLIECHRESLASWIDDNEIVIVPATYRDVVDAGIPIAGGIGVDDAERNALLDESGHVRLIKTGGRWVLQEYIARLFQPIAWTPMVDWPTFASGNKTQCYRRDIQHAIENLADNLSHSVTA